MSDTRVAALIFAPGLGTGFKSLSTLVSHPALAQGILKE